MSSPHRPEVLGHLCPSDDTCHTLGPTPRPTAHARDPCGARLLADRTSGPSPPHPQGKPQKQPLGGWGAWGGGLRQGRGLKSRSGKRQLTLTLARGFCGTPAPPQPCPQRARGPGQSWSCPEVTDASSAQAAAFPADAPVGTGPGVSTLGAQAASDLPPDAGAEARTPGHGRASHFPLSHPEKPGSLPVPKGPLRVDRWTDRGQAGKSSQRSLSPPHRPLLLWLGPTSPTAHGGERLGTERMDFKEGRGGPCGRWALPPELQILDSCSKPAWGRRWPGSPSSSQPCPCAAPPQKPSLPSAPRIPPAL